MNEKRLLAGYSFDENGPYLKLDPLGKNPKRENLHLRGKTLTLRATAERNCIGQYNLDTLGDFPCPENKALQTAANTCAKCFAAIGFNPAFYNVPLNQLSPQQKKYNMEPHSVYLANFQQGQTKVGIANARRTKTRLLEQGARSALVVAECQNAYEARDMEVSISRNLGLTESARVATKRKWISEPYNPSAGAQELIGHRASLDKDGSAVADQGKVFDLTPNYLGPETLHYPIDDLSDKAPILISGRIVGMIGDVLIVEQLQSLFMLSMGKLISHVVEISDNVTPLKSSKTQLSLF